jgi:hypothetical protein
MRESGKNFLDFAAPAKHSSYLPLSSHARVGVAQKGQT